SLNLKVGEQVQVKALATYTDQTEEDVTKPALWVSSKITVVTVKDGIVKANGKGKATITVSYGDKKTKIVVEAKEQAERAGAATRCPGAYRQNAESSAVSTRFGVFCIVLFGMLARIH